MSILERAKRFVSEKFLSAISRDVEIKSYAFPQGPITATRPISFSPDGYFIDDLCFFLAPGQAQDMGALFTQKQLNDSIDLKSGILSGDLTFLPVGTIPITEPISGGGIAAVVQVQDSLTNLINPAKEDGYLKSIYDFLISYFVTGATNTSVTSVPGSVTSVQLLPANGTRKGVIIFNDSTSILYIKLGAAAAINSFTARMIPNAYFEMPFNYTGRVDGVWASAVGNARITEVLP